MGFFGAVGNWIDTHFIQGVKNFGRFLKGLLKTFWTSFHEKINNIIQKVSYKINKAVLGVLTYLRKGLDGMISRVTSNFVKVDNDYEEIEVISKPISPSEVPQEFLDKMRYSNEIDVSNNYLDALTA
ncbi:MAG: hypothetical protein NC395_06100 [Prevotella sp.]|nr:hypothetical protein [Prevotella sp.]